MIRLSSYLLAFLFFVSTAKAQSHRLDSTVTAFAAASGFEGVVLVATDGKVDHSSAIGLADRSTGRPIQTADRFRIASMTKAFTAVLVMKLVEEGKLALDAPIGRYLPEYTGACKDVVTINHLLTYSSGIEDQLSPKGMEPYRSVRSLDDFIRTYCSGPLVVQPGTKSVYGNTEYVLLHRIIEKVSGKSYAAYLDAVILRPLQLTNTGLIDDRGPTKNLVPTYTYDDSLKTYAANAPYYASMYFGAGALYATADDLLVFIEACSIADS